MFWLKYLLLRSGEDIAKFTPVMVLLCGCGFLFRWLINDIGLWAIVPIVAFTLLLGWLGDRLEKKLDARERKQKTRRRSKNKTNPESGWRQVAKDREPAIREKESTSWFDLAVGYCLVIVYLAGLTLFWLFWVWLVFKVSAWAIAPMICTGALVGWLTWRAQNRMQIPTGWHQP